MAIANTTMQKNAYFDDHWGEGWPALDNIRSCLIDRTARASFFKRGRDGGSFFIEDAFGAKKRALYMHMNPEHGVKLQYSKADDVTNQLLTHHSKGDLSRLREFVRSFHGTPLSLGLFIPFEAGWTAVKEFIETEGNLPTSIDWIGDRDLPPETFPDP